VEGILEKPKEPISVEVIFFGFLENWNNQLIFKFNNIIYIIMSKRKSFYNYLVFFL